jgi:hypothetical protein
MNIFDHFQHLELTTDQECALGELESFLEEESHGFLLKGYAGTGKTTLVQGLISHIKQLGFPVHLMAPTGRAAKILNEKTQQQAFTIHKSIYNFDDLIETKDKNSKDDDSYKYYFKLRENQNLSKDIFIVDEASMISDVYAEHENFFFGSGHLLNDLIRYTRIKSANNRVKIIFIGDNAQLPPVGMNLSPALEYTYLSKNYNIHPEDCELEQVVRHNTQNGILKSATRIRNGLHDKLFNHFDLTPDQKTIFQIQKEQLVGHFMEKINQSVIIAYKNRTAMEWNKAIHQKRFPQSENICSNDTVIVGRNNYFHGIFNGDFGVVIKASPGIDTRRQVTVTHEGEKHKVVLEWRYVELLFQTETNEKKVVKGYMLENFFNTEESSLSSLEQKALYIDFKIRNSHLKPGTPEFKDAIKEDPLFNAIMIKYGYAVTCHKAQGGEWENAFVIWDYNTQRDFNVYHDNQTTSGHTNEGFFRWAYTAITRAEKNLYNINPPYFTPFYEMDFVPTVTRQQLDELHGVEKKCVQVQFKDYEELLRQLHLTESAFFLQNKAIELHYLLSERYIHISRREAKPYHEIYTFKRDDKKAKVTFYYNGQNKFTKIQKVPKGTNSEEFFKEIQNLLNQNIDIEVLTQTNFETQQDSSVFLPEFPDDKPYLEQLYNLLLPKLKEKNIQLLNIDHLNYRERYKFEQNQGEATLDFVYNGGGFFTHVEEQEHTSPNLVIDLYDIIQSIK